MRWAWIWSILRCELVGKIPAGQVDISQRRVRMAMPGECRDRMQLPTHPGQIRQTQVPSCVRGKPRNIGGQRDPVHHLRPRPQAQLLRVITAGLREGTAVHVPYSDSPGARDRPTAAHRSQPCTAAIRSSRFFVVSARILRAEVGGVEIVGAQRAQLLTAQRCAVGQGEHRRSFGPVPRRRLRGCPPTAVRWESTAASSIGAQAYADAHCRADRAYRPRPTGLEARSPSSMR